MIRSYLFKVCTLYPNLLLFLAVVFDGNLDLNTRFDGNRGLQKKYWSGTIFRYYHGMLSAEQFVGIIFIIFLLTICLTISEELQRSITRLWILISKRSQVLLPIYVILSATALYPPPFAVNNRINEMGLRHQIIRDDQLIAIIL